MLAEQTFLLQLFVMSKKGERRCACNVFPPFNYCGHHRLYIEVVATAKQPPACVAGKREFDDISDPRPFHNDMINLYLDLSNRVRGLTQESYFISHRLKYMVGLPSFSWYAKRPVRCRSLSILWRRSGCLWPQDCGPRTTVNAVKLFGET